MQNIARDVLALGRKRSRIYPYRIKSSEQNSWRICEVCKKYRHLVRLSSNGKIQNECGSMRDAVFGANPSSYPRHDVARH